MKLITCYLMAALVSTIAAGPTEARLQQESPDVSAYRPIFEAMRSKAPISESIELIEAFLADPRPEFFESRYRKDVYLILLSGYLKEKRWSNAIETIDRLDKLVPGFPNSRRLQCFAEGMSIALTELKDRNKAKEYAQKIIAIDPSNANARQVLESRPTNPK